MAYIRRHRDGWRAEVTRKGHPRQSKVFATKTAASAWAARVEASIIDGTASRWPAKTLADAMDRYSREVSSGKRGARTEVLRFAAVRRDYPVLCSKLLHAIDAADLARWRDDRLQRVARSTVQRDINLLRNVWTIAAREWGWCGESPWRLLRMPGENPPRERVASWRELRRILRRCGYVTGVVPCTGLESVAWAVLVAMRTGMRAGEIMGMQVGDLSGGVVTLEQHKTLHITRRARRVPLTHRGRWLLEQLQASARARGDQSLWLITGKSLDTLFRKARDQCLVHGLHFHDLRATFATCMARRVDALTLAKILGHADVRQTMTYYRESEDDISRRISAAPSRPALARGPTSVTSG